MPEAAWPAHMSKEVHSLVASVVTTSSHCWLTAPLKMETPLSAMEEMPSSHSFEVVLVAMTGYAGMSMTWSCGAASVSVPSAPMTEQPGGPSLPVQME